MCQVENEDLVGAAPTGDAPTASKWSTILLPNKVRLMLEVLWYVQYCSGHVRFHNQETFSTYYNADFN